MKGTNLACQPFLLDLRQSRGWLWQHRCQRNFLSLLSDTTRFPAPRWWTWLTRRNSLHSQNLNLQLSRWSCCRRWKKFIKSLETILRNSDLHSSLSDATKQVPDNTRTRFQSLLEVLHFAIAFIEFFKAFTKTNWPSQIQSHPRCTKCYELQDWSFRSVRPRCRCSMCSCFQYQVSWLLWEWKVVRAILICTECYLTHRMSGTLRMPTIWRNFPPMNKAKLNRPNIVMQLIFYRRQRSWFMIATSQSSISMLAQLHDLFSSLKDFNFSGRFSFAEYFPCCSKFSCRTWMTSRDVRSLKDGTLAQISFNASSTSVSLSAGPFETRLRKRFWTDVLMVGCSENQKVMISDQRSLWNIHRLGWWRQPWSWLQCGTSHHLKCLSQTAPWW